MESPILVNLKKGVNEIAESNTKVFVAFFVIISFLVADTMINYVSDLAVPFLISTPSIIFYAVATSVCIIGQLFILEFIKTKSKGIRERDHYISIIHRTVSIAQYVLISVALFVLGQILVTSQYHIASLFLVTAVSQILTIGIMLIFSQRFFAWFRLNRSSVVVLVYGLAFVLGAISLMTVSARELYLFFIKDHIVTPASKVVFPYDYIEPGSFLDNIWLVYQYLEIVVFVLLIAATALLLKHYSNKIGRVKFWTFICLPLAYYVSTSIEVLGLYEPETDLQWFYWWLYISLNSTAGGILFGLAFRSVASTIREDSQVRQYLIIAAYGFVLYFVSNQITLIGASFPPYGLITLTFLSLASYMIFLGLYSTALSISQDNKLRNSIRKMAEQNTNLLSSIGTAQMESEIQNTVNSMKGIVQEQERQLEEQTGIEANLEEDEMKKYLEEVMQEVGKSKKPSA